MILSKFQFLNHLPIKMVILLMVFSFFSACQTDKPQKKTTKSQQQQDEPMVDVMPKEDIPPAPVLSSQEALADFEIVDDFEIQLVAEEPAVEDPVAIKFDGDGNMWVVEMRAYMPDIEGNGEDERIGRIAILKDLDADGFYERKEIFMDSLLMPRAICLVEGGVLLIEPPALYFVENNNNKAGKKILIDASFAVGGNVEHQPNGLLYAQDNWIYCAKAKKRIRLIDGIWKIEPTRFRGQWGIAQDDYGQLYYNDNSTTLAGDNFRPNAVPTNEHYDKLSKRAYVDVKCSNRVFPRRINPGVNRAYRKATLGDDFKLTNVTGACGPTIYRGDNFPPEYYGNAFIPEPTGNLLKRIILKENDGLMNGRLAYEKAEFLTATDERFRPVNTFTAPDGSLYVVDFYRGLIQHITYLTEYLKRQTRYRDLDKPTGLGRIYRIKYKENTLGPQPRMLNASSKQLVGYLAHPNGWWRDKAQQLLVQRNDPSTVKALKTIAQESENHLAKIHALWTLEGMNKIDIRTLDQALYHSKHPRVKASIFSLLQTFSDKSKGRIALDLLYKNSFSDDRLSNMQAALSIASFTSKYKDDAFEALGRYLSKYKADDLFIDLLMSSLAGKEASFRDYLVASDQTIPKAMNQAIDSVLVRAERQAAISIPHPDQLDAALLLGKRLFQTYCQSCHGDDGKGIEKMAPPLVQSEWVLQDKETLIRIALDGLTGPIDVKGISYYPPKVQTVMPGIRHTPGLTDEKIAAILSYIRNDWGNKAQKIEGDEVKKIRSITKTRDQLYTAGELKKLSVNN